MVLKKAKPIQINANYRKTEALLESGQIENVAETDLSNVNVGSENYGKSLMVDSDGDIEFGNPSFTPGESGVVVPDTPATGANAVNKNYVDANTVNLTGTQTISGQKSMTNTDNDVRVKTTPEATTSAVNQAYVESTVDGVNNLVHKSGAETITGSKTFTSPAVIRQLGKLITNSGDTTNWYEVCSFEHTTGSPMVNLKVRGNYANEIVDMSLYIRPSLLKVGNYNSTFNMSLDNIIHTKKLIEGVTYIKVYVKLPVSCRLSVCLDDLLSFGNPAITSDSFNFAIGDGTPISTIDPADYDTVVSATKMTGVIS